jgi:hypothetical protein
MIVTEPDVYADAMGSVMNELNKVHNELTQYDIAETVMVDLKIAIARVETIRLLLLDSLCAAEETKLRDAGRDPK